MESVEHSSSLLPRRAFSLLELLVAIAILAVLLGLLVPGAAKVRAASNNLVCVNNLREIGNAARMYANDNGGSFPNSYALGGSSYRRALGQKNPSDPFSLAECYGLQAVLGPYLAKNSKLWICPSANALFKTYGNCYAMGLVNDMVAAANLFPDTFFVYDNIGLDAALPGVRGTPSSPLPVSAWEYPHWYQTPVRSGSVNSNDRRGAINVLLLSGKLAKVLYVTDPDNPAGGPKAILIRDD